MLAALVPHGEKAWFFKLVGPRDNVDIYADAFRMLVESVKFADDDSAEPQWMLPEGWTPKSGKSEMRFATITLPEASQGLEVSVVPLPWMPHQYVNLLLTNINRWRKQMQLPPVRADELADEFTTRKASENEIVLVDLKGKLKPDSMQPPFAAAASGAPLPASHPPLKSAGAEKPAPVANDSKRETSAVTSNDSNLPFTFSVPADWKSKPAPTFAVAAFATKDDSAPVEVSITPMMGPGGDLLMNINRWRTMQLGLQPIKAEELSSVSQSMEISGKPAQIVRLVADKDAAGPRQAITAALIKTGDATWIFRMKGGAEAVEREQATFEKFLNSIKFRGQEN
jgi:hypothetical protein